MASIGVIESCGVSYNSLSETACANSEVCIRTCVCVCVCVREAITVYHLPLRWNELEQSMCQD